MNEESSFNVTKTFESKQKKERSNIDYFAAHPQFWKNLPEELTKKGEILSLIHDGKAVKLKIPGYLSFYIKAIDVDGTRNGAHVLC